MPASSPESRSYAANGSTSIARRARRPSPATANGNPIADASTAYVHDVENRAGRRSGGHDAALRYDPLGRLYEIARAAGTCRFLHDGDALAADYGAAGVLGARVVGSG